MKHGQNSHASVQSCSSFFLSFAFQRRVLGPFSEILPCHCHGPSFLYCLSRSSGCFFYVIHPHFSWPTSSSFSFYPCLYYLSWFSIFRHPHQVSIPSQLSSFYSIYKAFLFKLLYICLFDSEFKPVNSSTQNKND